MKISRRITKAVFCLTALVLAATVFFPRALFAGLNAWTVSGPGGGAVYSLTPITGTVTTLYAGGDGGIWTSSDDAKTWTLLDGSPTEKVFSLAISPGNAAVIYAGTAYAVYKSTDSGSTWTSLFSLSDAVTQVPYAVKFLAVSPVIPTVVYAGFDSTAGLYQSLNAGASWAALTTNLPSTELRGLSADPLSTLVYATFAFYGVYRGASNGTTWVATNSGLGCLAASCPDTVGPIASDPSNQGMVYAAYGTNLFRSANSGSSWSSLYGGSWPTDAGTQVNAVVTHSCINDSVFASTTNGIFRADYNSTAWSRLKDGLPANALHNASANTLSLNCSNGVFAGTDTGVYATGATGTSWTAQNAGLYNTTPMSLAIARDGTIFAGTRSSGIFKSVNNGDTWTAVNSGLTRIHSPTTQYDYVRISAVAVDPADSSTVYATGGVQDPFGGVADFGGSFFQSNDGGATWTLVTAGPGADSLILDSIDPTTLYAVSGKKFYTGTNGGADWSSLSTNVSFLSLAAGPTSYPLYAATTTGVWTLDAAGGSWSSLGLSSNRINVVAVDPNIPETIYVGSSTGPYKSMDGGTTWKKICGGKICEWISALAVNPSDSSVYAGTAEGLWKSTDGGTSWTQITMGMSVPRAVTSIAFDDGASAVHAGLLGNGVADYNEVAMAGSLKVTMLPSNVVAKGAQWNMDGRAWQSNGTTLNYIPVDSHIVNFKTLPGWATPDPQTVVIAKGKTTSVTGTYVRIPNGSLTVTLTPAAAASAGATWSVDGGDAQKSGATVQYLTVGSHTVTFQDVTGWATPASQTVTIQDTKTTKLSAAYVKNPAGSLTVKLGPSTAVSAGARWILDGGVEQKSGVTLKYCPVGSYTVTF